MHDALPALKKKIAQQLTVFDEVMNEFERMSREDLLKLLKMFAKNGLAHDGCWFRVGNRKAYVLLSVCEAQTRYSFP